MACQLVHQVLIRIGSSTSVAPTPPALECCRWPVRQPPASSAIELEQYTRSVAQEVEYPQIRYVVPPTRMDGIPTGQAPRMRHDLGCQQFEWPDGTSKARMLRCPGTRSPPRSSRPTG